jgi:hypothetical protein
MDSAAKYGHLEVVKWLYENRTEGKPAHALERARYNGCTNVVEYLSRVISNQ